MTREEAIKRFGDLRKLAQKTADEFEETFPRHVSNWRYDVELYEMAIAALREQDATDTNVGHTWVSVADQMPKPYETVLVIRRNQRKQFSVECGYYMGHGDWRVGTRLTRPVTHWMPLPELPEVEV